MIPGNLRPIITITRIKQGRKLALPILAALLAASCGSSPSAPSSTAPPAAPLAHWALSGAVSSSAGGPITSAVVTVLDGPDANRTTTSDAAGRFALAGLQQAGFSIRVSARSYTAVIRGINLTANIVSDFVLPLPLARLVDIGGSDIRYDRVAGGFDMFAMTTNEGPGCANAVSGVTLIKNAAPPNATLAFSWSLPADRIVLPGETFEYHVGFMTNDQARKFPEGSASTKFNGFSIRCP